jgi:hypothetical protein
MDSTAWQNRSVFMMGLTQEEANKIVKGKEDCEENRHQHHQTYFKQPQHPGCYVGQILPWDDTTLRL